MTVDGLIENLQLVKKAHPEVANTEIWAYIEEFGTDGEHITLKSHLKFFRFDKRHHPPRIILE